MRTIDIVLGVTLALVAFVLLRIPFATGVAAALAVGVLIVFVGASSPRRRRT